VWYTTTIPETNSDGKHVNFSHLRHLDDEVFDRLSELRSKERTIKAVENSGVLPAETVYFAKPVPHPNKPTNWELQRQLRAFWVQEALDVVKDADIVFLDPDNGVAPRGMSKSKRVACKYVFPDEIEHFYTARRSVVIYQRQQRRKLQDQIQDQLPNLKHLAPVWAVSFHAFSSRIYYVLPAKIHENSLRTRCMEMADGPWGKSGFCRHHSR
jgi:hypothetical protein